MPTKPIFDVIIVGSGAAGTHSAYPLVQKGLRVAMVDGGQKPGPIFVPGKQDTFDSVRNKMETQYKLFLGEELQGISLPREKTHSNMMTSGQKSHVARYTEELFIQNKDLSIIQSLARGGLLESWGGACDFFSLDELKAAGLPDLRKYYQDVIDLIGVSGESDTYRLQPPVAIDHMGRYILASYKKKHKKSDRFCVEKPTLALLTEKKNFRRATNYNDLDYWSDLGGSVYRARYTLDELEKHPNFSYFPDCLVEGFIERNGIVEVVSRRISANAAKKTENFRAKKLILAAGAPSTLRIFLRSKNAYDVGLPLLIKHHILIPCVVPNFLGKEGDLRKHSLCQLFIKDKNKMAGLDQTFVQIYSYKSLLLHKLISLSPLPLPETAKMFALMTPATIIADMRFVTLPSEKCMLYLRKDGVRDYLEIKVLHGQEETAHARQIKEVKKFLFSLGLIPLKVVVNPLGSTAHYAGGLPLVRGGESRGTGCDGKITGTENIYVADASGWRMLPPKPPALTIMANARRIGLEVASTLE
ncbi:MAG TPA: FAD-binding protein [Candidatus Nanoarchaeia archaeon]|nr:FAD-binding protein [Candidatus Nanoarchaeia archaeon]